MSKHRLQPPPRVRPRVGRIAAAGVSLIITSIALLGGIGVIPLGGAGDSASGTGQAPASSNAGAAAGHDAGPITPSVTPTPSSTPTPSAPRSSASSTTKTKSGARVAGSPALPASSGTGRRVVFSMSDQRVWLVDAQGAAFSTYLVSGSLTDNLHPGSYHVYSRSRWAVGVDDSGVMQYFVRFTRGNNAAIGFHSIPTKNGQPLQTSAQLGTPQSHGCIRQKLSDAVQMWGFAHTGTSVVVVA